MDRITRRGGLAARVRQRHATGKSAIPALKELNASRSSLPVPFESPVPF